jgi:two-component system, chemotaxis family, chemotaxis protein CheY
MKTLKTLIVEDDFTSRLLLQEILREYGASHVAVDGKEAVEAVRIALQADEPYDLICLDIMMPEMDGQQALKEIRALEKSKPSMRKEAKIVMTTALTDMKNVYTALSSMCDAYLTKPVHKAKLVQELRKLDLVQ